MCSLASLQFMCLVFFLCVFFCCCFFAVTKTSNCREYDPNQGLGMSHSRTAFPKPSFRTSWKVGNAMVGRGNAGWIVSKNGHPCPCQNCSQGPRSKDWKRISAELPLMSPDDPIGQESELNWVWSTRIFSATLCACTLSSWHSCHVLKSTTF